ncbi:MAG: pancreas/duodenum homeobox protein 1 [Deltaproteobacteria bacterium]|nr:pancreas/duodenum homeobox protein 1 [Deltaproteobacteria bacterium]
MAELHDIFTDETLRKLFPAGRADDFFEALFGDAREGAYNISLKFVMYVPEEKKMYFELHLNQRPGRCLACNLTYGLPDVFSRHPVINIKGLVEEINKLLGSVPLQCQDWSLKSTQSISSALHVIPLVIKTE